MKYAQVMALLGMPVEEVEAAFKKAISFCQEDKFLNQAKMKFGCYYLFAGEYEKARNQFQEANTQGDVAPFWKKTAQCGLRLIRAGRLSN